MLDLNWEHQNVQLIRLKIDQLNGILISFLRSICKISFFKKQERKAAKEGISFSKPRIYLTKPVNLFFERYVMIHYLEVIKCLDYALNSQTSLETDLALLKKPDLPFNERMVVVYRSEKKKILKSQIHLTRKVLTILNKAEAAL